jgi:hypothetical protein
MDAQSRARAACEMAGVDVASLVLAGDAPPAPLRRVAERVVQRYGAAHRPQFTFLANWNENKGMRPPNGFVFSVRAGAPVHPDPFDPERAYNGTVAVALPPNCAAERMSLEELRRAVGGAVTLDAQAGIAFAGVYRSDERGRFAMESRAWIVVQGGSTPAARDLFRAIEEAAEENEAGAPGFPSSSSSAASIPCPSACGGMTGCVEPGRSRPW